ncbi:MAG: hypothetical protein IJS14_12725 [Lentisphaeria bacterium]|nr:hypothetical protein [Lentisphaeria bacterium]
MKRWVANILTVQQYDMKLRALETKYRTIPQERANLRELYDAAKAKLENARTAAVQAAQAVRQTESEIAVLNENIRKLLTQSAMVKKNAEYQAMMTDIENAKARISDLETKQLEQMDEQAAAAKAAAEEEKSFAATESQLKAEAAEFKELVEHIKTEAIRLKAEKKQFMPRVELHVLNAYKTILAKDKGPPVVPIRNGSCGYCSMAVPPQEINEARKGQLVFCDNCAHILYDPDCEP